VITTTTVIDGGGTVTLSGGEASRIFLVESEVDLTLQNLTLADARVSGPRGDGPGPDNSGAAVYRHSASALHVIDVVFRNNHATDTGADIGGGAIYSYGGDTIITGSTFDDNSGASGGAIGNLRSNLAVYNSSFANNRAVDGNGGAMYLDGQNPDQGKVFTVCGVIATNNRARREGGAIYRYGYPDESTVIDLTTLDGNAAEDADAPAHAGGLYHHTDTPGVMPLFLRNSTISNNTSARGAGGLFFFNSPVELVNVTIAGNVAESSLAGAIAANGVSGTLESCTIADNHADASDSFAGAIIGGNALTITNTIIADNTGGNEFNPVSCTDTAAGGDHNLQFPAQQESGQDDTPCVPGIDFADPLLGPLQDNGGPTPTMALLPGSPALGAGADCPETDQRGVAREGGCDIGAYQHDP
jgi:predicted outer membrane repeat protein